MEKYLISVALTIAVECTLALFQSKNKDWTIVVLLVNLITNPMANLLFNGIKPLLSGNGVTVMTVLIEAAVIVTEAILFYRYRKKERHRLKSLRLHRCFLYSFDLNLISFIIGVIIQKMITK